MRLAKRYVPSPPNWRPYDAAPAVRAAGGIRRGVLLGAVAGVEAAAVIRGKGGRSSRGADLTAASPNYGMPSDS